MKEYIRMNAKNAIHSILLVGLGYDINIKDIQPTLHLYHSSCGIYEYKDTSYHGYICYRIGKNGKECAIYYDYWNDTEKNTLEYTAVIVSNDGVQIGKVD